MLVVMVRMGGVEKSIIVKFRLLYILEEKK